MMRDLLYVRYSQRDEAHIQPDRTVVFQNDWVVVAEFDYAFVYEKLRTLKNARCSV